MRSVIRIAERTSVSEVLGWTLSDDTEFVLFKSSSFLPGAQGIAVATLRTLGMSSSKLTLTCEFQEPGTASEAEDYLFGTPFGFSLVRLATTINFLPGIVPKGGNFKRLMGRLYVDERGCLGVGKQTSLISVDPRFPFPPVLKEDVQAGDVEFPAPSKFLSVLAEMAASIGFSRALTSAVESPLIDYIYEIARNSWEHGIPTACAPNASTRAVILEKIVIQENDQFGRYPDYLQEYLLRVKEEMGAQLGVGVLCVTVVDQGIGIQTTLPAKEGESDASRLERAFGDGESRKPKGSISRGMGLSKALSAAFKLRAMLQICSDGLLGMQDFSTGEDKYPGINLEVSRIANDLYFGTSISLFVPEFSGSLDQPSLFEG